jgi:hypothetical protein
MLKRMNIFDDAYLIDDASCTHHETFKRPRTQINSALRFFEQYGVVGPRFVAVIAIVVSDFVTSGIGGRWECGTEFYIWDLEWEGG